MRLDFLFQFALGVVVKESEKLRLVQQIGVIMNTTDELTGEEQETQKDEREAGKGVVINVNASGDKRVAARDYVEIHIHCGDHCPLAEESPGSGTGAAA